MRLGITVAEARQSGGLSTAAALHLDGPYILSPGDHVIDLVPAFPPVGDFELHRIETVAQTGADGIFHQPSPPDRVVEGVGKGSRGKRINQGVVPEDQLRAASALSLCPSGEQLQAARQKSRFEKPQVMGQRRRVSRIMKLAEHLGI